MSQFEINRTILTTFFNDSTLKEYMKIPTADLNNLATFRDKYCVTGVVADTTLTEEPVRLVYKNPGLLPTSNFMVKNNYLVIEIFVKDTEEFNVDATDRLIRRQDRIVQRICKLICNKRVSNFMVRLSDKGDLFCATKGYKRSFVKIEYKHIG